MNEENKVVETKYAIGLINDSLNSIADSPKVSCKVKTSDNEIIDIAFVLDAGAVEILKAYYKSKCV